MEDPGPGAYDLSSSQSGPRFTIPKANKQGLGLATDQAPGPGTYDLAGNVVRVNTAASLTPRRPASTAFCLLVPGPGTYSPLKRMFVPAYSIGKSLKLDGRSRAKTPSPADYAPNPQFRSVPTCAIGHSRRDLTKVTSVTTPGPGTYSPKTLDSTPQFTIKQRLGETQRLPLPVPFTQGPGQYSPNTSQVLEKTKMPIIGSEQKFVRRRLGQGPDPGSYMLRGQLGGPRYTFSRSVRRSRQERSASPGPGQYSIPSAVANVPSYVRLKRE